MYASQPKVSIIIATTASELRSSLLMRALQSLQQQSEDTVPIFVINGKESSPDLVEWLKRRPDIRQLRLEEANLPEALLAGRNAVDTEFFGILDDDDEYLPGAIPARLRPMLDDPSIDIVITNGLIVESGQERIALPAFSKIPVDPLGQLMDRNWLPSCAALYRTARLPASYLKVPRFREYTYMAMKIALTRKLHFVDVPTYCVHRGTPGSLSSTSDYARAEPLAIQQMLGLKPPARIRRLLARNYSRSLHSLSDLARGEGDYWAAWRYHLRSLRSPYGVTHYALYTRYLVPSLFMARAEGFSEDS